MIGFPKYTAIPNTDMNRNKRKAALASAIIATSAIPSQAAVTATSTFDGTNSVVTLSFTEGVYTLGGSKGLLQWSGFTTEFADYNNSSFTATANTLASNELLNFIAASYNIISGKGTFELSFANTPGETTIFGGSITVTLAGDIPTGTFAGLSVGGFTGTDESLSVVPEPSGMALLLVGGIAVATRRKR